MKKDLRLNPSFALKLDKKFTAFSLFFLPLFLHFGNYTTKKKRTEKKRTLKNNWKKSYTKEWFILQFLRPFCGKSSIWPLVYIFCSFDEKQSTFLLWKTSCCFTKERSSTKTVFTEITTILSLSFSSTDDQSRSTGWQLRGEERT